MKKTMAWILVLLVACMGATACAQTLEVAPPTVDRAGNPIEVPAQVERLIVLAPSITQVVLDIGLGDKLVAVDTNSVYSADVPEDLPALDMLAPDMESMLALSPDLVLINSMSLYEGSDALDTLHASGVCVVTIPSSDSIEGILEDTLFIGQVLGREAEAKALNATLEEAIERYRVKADSPVAVYFEIDYPYTFGSGTFLNEMIEIIGGKNIFADQQGWISVSDESVIAAEPTVIFTNADWNPEAVSGILARDGWQTIPAVANEDVYLIDSNTSSQPNHRILLALEQMAEALENAGK